MGADPASWKTKCTIRKVDELGRLIDLEPASAHNVTSTVRMNVTPPQKTPSIAPFAYDLFPVAPWDDLDDRLPPAQNSDVIGVRTTQQVRIGRDSSFYAGVVSGFLALTLVFGIGYASMTSEQPDALRERHAVAHRASTLEVTSPEYAEGRAAPGVRHLLQPGELVTPDMLPDAK